jgi:hypothetical protein
MIASKTEKDTYLAHGVDSNLLRFYLQFGGANVVMLLPICPKCERIGLRDRGWSTHKIMSCPHCGYHGKATHALSTYLKEGCYR